jgi:hypothetical protein
VHKYLSTFIPLFKQLNKKGKYQMLRILMLALSIVLISQLSVAKDSEILINTPKEVIAGNDFLMIISIPTNYLEGISRIEFEFPNGFEAKVTNTNNADFKFSNQKALFQWLSFPKNKEVEISLTVSTAPTIEGYFVIRGVGSYLKHDEPVRVELFPQIITVKASDVSELALIQQKELTKISFDEFQSEGVACVRQVPYLEDSAIVVNLLVSKGDFNKYGKIQEKIPVGYEVVNVKSHNAIFVYSQKQRLVKYMWMNMPEKPKFVVSYKLVPTSEVSEDDPFLIYGEFYYADNNKTTSVNIQERGIDLSGN